MKKLKIAIIGCGRVAGHHARSIQSLTNKTELVAVCDLNNKIVNEFGKEYKTKAYNNYFNMLDDNPEIDLVSIVTPSGMHYEHSNDIIENFKKHVVIEKPLVMNLKQGENLKRNAKLNNVNIFPVFQYRYNKSVQRVLKAIQDDELGNIFLGTVRTRWCRPQSYYDRDIWRGTFSHDGGACTNQGIHHLDLLRYLGGEVKRVNAKMNTYGVSCEVEDTVVATIEFESGAVGVIEITVAARPDDFESSISILGSKGVGIIGGWATNELIKFSPDKTEEVVHSEKFPDVYGYGHKEIYKQIYNCIINNEEPPITFDDAMKSIKLLNSLYKSDEIENWVDLKNNESSTRLGRNDESISKLYRSYK